MSDLSCCGSYMECSKADKCIKLDSNLYESFYKFCNYKNVLESGKNFYVKNEVMDQVQEIKILSSTGQVNPKIEPAAAATEIYLYCFNRFFKVSKRVESYKSILSYPLKDKDIEKVKSVFDKNKIPYDTVQISSLCMVDNGDQKVEYRVVFEIGEEKYHVLNFNSLCITEGHAVNIAHAFKTKGIEARHERLGVSAADYKPANRVKTVKQEKIKPVTDAKVEPLTVVKPEKKNEVEYIITKNGQPCLGVYKSLKSVIDIVEESNKRINKKSKKKKDEEYKRVYSYVVANN